MTFVVIDKQTGKEADLDAIAEEQWAYGGLVSADFWLIGQDGTLYLADNYGAWTGPPEGRFLVMWCSEEQLG